MIQQGQVFKLKATGVDGEPLWAHRYRVAGCDSVRRQAGGFIAAATGLRPSELFALERRDVDRAAGVVQIRRAYANGRVKHTKTRLSRRAVPLQRIALSRRSTSYARGRPRAAPSRYSTRSRSRGPWTLGGRWVDAGPEGRKAAPRQDFPLRRSHPRRGWTLGGRRMSETSLPVLPEGAD